MTAKVILFPDFKWAYDELPHGATNVWAKYIAGNHHKMHFWQLDGASYRALCGYRAPATLRNGQNSLFGESNHPKCGRCMSAQRQGR